MNKIFDTILGFLVKIWVEIKPAISIYGTINFFRSKTFLIMIIVVIALGFGRSCANVRDLKRQNDIKEQNIAALTDTVKMERTKSGKLEATVAGLITSEKELKQMNIDLYNEVSDQKGKVISLNKAVIELKQNTSQLKSHINYLESVMNQPIQINDSVYNIVWQLDYEWDSINYDEFIGETTVTINPKQPTPFSFSKWGKPKFENIFELRHDSTRLLERSTRIDLTFGQEIVDDKLRVFVSTKYPGFSAASLQGWMIDPNTDSDIKKLIKKKKWIPNTWSVGGGPSFGYNLLSGKPYLGIGININYNLLQW